MPLSVQRLGLVRFSTETITKLIKWGVPFAQCAFFAILGVRLYATFSGREGGFRRSTGNWRMLQASVPPCQRHSHGGEESRGKVGKSA